MHSLIEMPRVKSPPLFWRGGRGVRPYPRFGSDLTHYSLVFIFFGQSQALYCKNLCIFYRSATPTTMPLTTHYSPLTTHHLQLPTHNYRPEKPNPNHQSRQTGCFSPSHPLTSLTSHLSPLHTAAAVPVDKPSSRYFPLPFGRISGIVFFDGSRFRPSYKVRAGTSYLRFR